MSKSTRQHESAYGRENSFTTTLWSVVIAAGRSDSPQAHEALQQLCSTYWYPLYAFLRRKGHSPEDAEDLNQGFFALLIENKGLAQVHPEKGRFRSFLLSSLQNYEIDAWDKARAQKRGGKMKIISLDAQTAEERYSREPVDDLTPERIYDQRWATTLLGQVHSRLKQEFAAAGKNRWFEALKGFLVAKKTGKAYAQIAEQLGATENAVRCAVQRLRQHYRDSIRAEVAKTVAHPADVDEEIRYLMTIVGS